MKKICNQFLIITFAISYACFGAILYSGIHFSRLAEHPLYMALFALGFMGPFIAAIAVHGLNRETLGGIKGLWDKIIKVENSKSSYLILLFLAMHYIFAVSLKVIGDFSGFGDFIKYLPVMLVLFGSQEIGWRAIVQPRYEESKGFARSAIITGLMWSIWFLPLIFVPGFVADPNFFIQLSTYLVGISMLQATIYKKSGSILYCIIFSTLFFALYGATGLIHSNSIIFVALVDAVMTYLYNGRLFK